MRLAMRLAVLLACCPQIACALVFQGTTETVHLESEPRAEVRRSSGEYLGPTPLDAKINRQHPSNLEIHQQGYSDEQLHFERHADAGWFVWDLGTCIIPVLLCVPMIADAISGAFFSFDDEYRVKLKPGEPPAPPPARPAALAPTPADTSTPQVPTTPL